MAMQTRRDFLISAGAVAAVSALGITDKAVASTELAFKPEDDAELNVLRWTQFVPAEEKRWMANTKKFTELTGIKVQMDRASFEDIRPKAAVAARVGSGPDIILGWFDDPHRYPGKLMDVSDVANNLAQKYGDWYDVCKTYGMNGKQWIGIPIAVIGNEMVYRKSHVQAAGFEEFPQDFPGFLKLCQALHAKGTPPGFPLGHSVLDGNGWIYWMLWGHGGKVVDEKGNVVLDSPETVAALEYVKELYKTFAPGTLSWQDPSNNTAFFDNKVSLINNGISVYFSALNSKDAARHALADDIFHSHLPVGPIGKPAELQGLTQMMLFNYTKYPNAAKAYMQFMMEAEQYNPWLEDSLGYVGQTLKAYEKNPIWTSNPKITVYRDVASRMLPDGYAGPLGTASAAVMADYVVIDMFALAASGSKSPKDAAAEAAERAKRFYKS